MIFLPNSEDTLTVLLLSVTAFIGVRALYLYVRIRSPRLFILGLSMSMIAFTALTDLVLDNIDGVSLDPHSFLYAGQLISYACIFLSMIKSSEQYQRKLMIGQSIFSASALLLLILAPVLPQFSHEETEFILRGTRCLLCFAICFYYIAAFMSKQSRFSLLMGMAFLMLSIGDLLIVEQYGIEESMLLHTLGDISQMGGLVALLFAVLLG
jgi:hypothetical protein